MRDEEKRNFKKLTQNTEKTSDIGNGNKDGNPHTKIIQQYQGSLNNQRRSLTSTKVPSSSAKLDRQRNESVDDFSRRKDFMSLKLKKGTLNIYRKHEIIRK